MGIVDMKNTFTYGLLETLSGKAYIMGDKKITVKELDAYLREQVPMDKSEVKRHLSVLYQFPLNISTVIERTPQYFH
jgi:DNA-binding transcriptional ArsR family regulator